jgi:endoglucanase
MEIKTGVQYFRKTFYLLFITVLFFSSLSISFAADEINAYDGDVLVNQIGYLPGADKVATVISSAAEPLEWKLVFVDNNKVAAEGKTTVFGYDEASRDELHHADFSSMTETGTFILSVDGVGESLPFAVTDNLYAELPNDAMAYYYFHRMGEDLLAEHLPDPAYARKALHPGDEALPCWKNWCGDELLNARYSWADAGDFGVYAVNHAISAWTLLNLYERYPHAFPDNSLNIPEQDNGIPDILDEVLFGSTFMKGILPKEGLASHKIHNSVWSAFPVTEVEEENAMERMAQPPSTNATYAVARTMAHLARLLEPFDAQEAENMWAIAKDAWARADADPDRFYVSGSDAGGGGDYSDTIMKDDRYAAASEMYLTSHHRNDADKETYKAVVIDSSYYKKAGTFNWREVSALGTLSMLSAPNDLPETDMEDMRENAVTSATQHLNLMGVEGYPVALPHQLPYNWGSNSFILNKMIYWGYAYDITQDLKYLKGMHRSMDYLLGNNAMKISYITGYGPYAETDVHDRWAWGRYLDGIPFPKGWVSGGPNNESFSDSVTPAANAAPKAYAGKDTAPDAYASKEVTINWNAPLVWVSYYLQDHQADLGGIDPYQEEPFYSDPSFQWSVLAGFVILVAGVFYLRYTAKRKK